MLKDINTSIKEIKKFGFTVGLSFIIIGVILLSISNSSYPLIVLGLSILVCAIYMTFILKPIYIIWMLFSNIIGWFMTRVILCILYFILITPIGLSRRLLGKQFIELKWDKSKKTYWTYSSSRTTKDNYEKQY